MSLARERQAGGMCIPPLRRCLGLGLALGLGCSGVLRWPSRRRPALRRRSRPGRLRLRLNSGDSGGSALALRLRCAWCATGREASEVALSLLLSPERPAQP